MEDGRKPIPATTPRSIIRATAEQLTNALDDCRGACGPHHAVKFALEQFECNSGPFSICRSRAAHRPERTRRARISIEENTRFRRLRPFCLQSSRGLKGAVFVDSIVYHD